MNLLISFFQVFIVLGIFNFGDWFKNNGLFSFFKDHCSMPNTLPKGESLKERKKNINDRAFGVYPFFLLHTYLLISLAKQFVSNHATFQVLTFCK
jgi:hypothetical protein